MIKHKNKLIGVLIVAVILAFAFWQGGNTPGLSETNINSENTLPTQTISPTIQPTEENINIKEDTTPVENIPQNKDTKKASADISNNANTDIDINVYNDTGKDEYIKEPTTTQQPISANSENFVTTDEKLTCTLSVRCDTILDNISYLDKNKKDVVPEDGIIFAEKTVLFYEGESVFNLLLREMKQNKIHMEYTNTPIYNSAYIEGIGNIYEFDCGELSGWTYKVNGQFPNHGCSRYQLKAGDKVEWVYTCNLGADVGASSGLNQKEE